MRQGDRQALRHALANRNQDLLDGLVVAMTFVGVTSEEIETELVTALAEQPSEVQHWWGAPCNCHGHLN